MMRRRVLIAADSAPAVDELSWIIAAADDDTKLDPTAQARARSPSPPQFRPSTFAAAPLSPITDADGSTTHDDSDEAAADSYSALRVEFRLGDAPPIAHWSASSGLVFVPPRGGEDAVPPHLREYVAAVAAPLDRNGETPRVDPRRAGSGVGRAGKRRAPRAKHQPSNTVGDGTNAPLSHQQMEAMTIEELKNCLRELRIPVSGNKDVLISRLEAYYQKHAAVEPHEGHAAVEPHDEPHSHEELQPHEENAAVEPHEEAQPHDDRRQPHHPWMPFFGNIPGQFRQYVGAAWEAFR